MDLVLARLKGLYHHRLAYTHWINDVSWEVTKVTAQDTCPKQFRVIAILLACEDMVKAGKKGNLEVAQFVRGFLVSVTFLLTDLDLLTRLTRSSFTTVAE
jgi:hypothetical protein